MSWVITRPSLNYVRIIWYYSSTSWAFFLPFIDKSEIYCQHVWTSMNSIRIIQSSSHFPILTLRSSMFSSLFLHIQKTKNKKKIPRQKYLKKRENIKREKVFVRVSLFPHMQVIWRTYLICTDSTHCEQVSMGCHQHNRHLCYGWEGNCPQNPYALLASNHSVLSLMLKHLMWKWSHIWRTWAGEWIDYM